MSQKSLNRPLNKLGKILLDYYWLLRGYRVGRLHRIIGISEDRFKEITRENVYTEEELSKIIDVLRLFRLNIDKKITRYLKELRDVKCRLNSGNTE